MGPITQSTLLPEPRGAFSACCCAGDMPRTPLSECPPHARVGKGWLDPVWACPKGVLRAGAQGLLVAAPDWLNSSILLKVFQIHSVQMKSSEMKYLSILNTK